MATNIVKCASCNVVINEALAFICNKLDVMDEQSIARICVSAFSESEILTAKNLLFESVSTTKPKKIRKRQGKSLRDIDDIICLLKETDPEEIPIFVAKDLQKLPPVLFDHVDVTKLLKDLLKMRSEIDRIAEEYATVNLVKDLAVEIDALKNASIVNNVSRNVNIRRGACALSSFEHESGPMGLSPMCYENKSVEKQPTTNPLKRQTNILSDAGSAVKTPRVIGTVTASPTSDRSSADRALSKAMVSHATLPTSTVNCVYSSERPAHQQSCAETRKSFSVVVQDGLAKPQSKSQKSDEKWTLVQRKKNRLRNRFVGNTGTAIVPSDNNFKAASTLVPIYVYNVSKETSENDIKSYLLKKTSLEIKLEKINMKSNRNYNGFIVFVPKQKYGMFMTEDFWPDGVLYRRFVDYNRNSDKPAYREIKGLISSVNG